MEFNPINTQEEFDARVSELYGDVTGLQEKVNTVTGERDAHAATITELQGRIKGYETADLRRNIAREKGLPHDMADRLKGDTEKDIRADAENLAGILRGIKGADPQANHDKPAEEGPRGMLRNMLRNMKGE